jgi:dTDP-4-amino-4,6-dideoxygalactose transaminase
MVNVTKTYLPPKEKYIAYLDKIYESGWVTNSGPLVKMLETRLAEFLGVKNVLLVSNGTAALEIAYRALELEGEAITTPFSFVATTSSLVTNNLNPVFADIDPNTLCIDTNEIRKHITPRTSAIVPVHVFGNASNVEQIDAIAKEFELKVVYDAAHAFGVRYKQNSLLSYGDISTLSFHATKLFHTIEGGALIINDDTLVKKARYLINFGIENEESIPELGINAKMNEFEAAMGLCILDEMEYISQERQKIHNLYTEALDGYVKFQQQTPQSTSNYSYMPVLFEDENTLLRIKDALNALNIFPRRYFYPSLDTLTYIRPKQHMPISRRISKTILCLPIYPGLEETTVMQIADTIKKHL